MARKPGEDLHNADFSGAKGRAWDLSGLSREDIRVEHTATLGGWLIEATDAHPLWNYHLAGVVHLRDIPGNPPAYKKFPEATHEFHLLPLDPETEDKIDLSDPRTLRPMKGSFDVLEHLVFPSDERAVEVVRLAIQECVNGNLIPDSDYRPIWGEFFRSQA